MRTVTEVHLGAQNVATGTRGTLYFDDFESRRFSYIGILPDPGLPVPEPPSQPGWDATNYTYDTNHVHAAITAGANTYTYDLNGNMTCRVEDGVTYKQIYNAENRLSTVQLVMSGTCASPTTIPSQWDFVYDGDGNRVKQTYTDFTTSPYTVTISSYFMGGLYEVTDSAVKKYYGIAGMMVAMNDGSSMKYLLTDHLGSVVAVTDASGALLSQQRYLPFGQERADLGPITQTDFGYTGQRNLADIGLMDYKARMYDSLLGRFVQPDSVIPGFADPQSWNRFAYVLNNPLRYIDPNGHSSCVGEHYDDGPECVKKNKTQYDINKHPENYTANDLVNRLLQQNKTRGNRLFWDGLSPEQRDVLAGGGWYRGAFNEMVEGGNATTADAWHDPLTYTEIAVIGGGLYQSLVDLATINGDAEMASIGSNGFYQKAGYTYFELPKHLYNFLSWGLAQLINRSVMSNQIEGLKDVVLTLRPGEDPGSGTEMEIYMLRNSGQYYEGTANFLGVDKIFQVSPWQGRP